jgi:hypothetical protein
LDFSRAKSASKARRKELDPGYYVGKLREYDLSDEGKLKSLFDKWTGEVDCAMVRFAQLTVRA